VAGVARVPFVAGIDNYLPAFFGKIHPKWKTPYLSILVQAVFSAAILVLSQINATVIGAYQFLVDMSVILYFIPFLYMYGAAIKLSYRADRNSAGAVLVPGGKPGIWIAGSLAFLITLGSMALAMIPPEGENKFVFEAKLVGCTISFVGFGLVLYFWRRMSMAVKVMVFAGLGGSIAAVWWVAIMFGIFSTATTLFSRIVLDVFLLTCPIILIWGTIHGVLMIATNIILYGALGHWILQKKAKP
jgi:amino acid transporter